MLKKQILPLLLCLCLTMGLCVPAAAATLTVSEAVLDLTAAYEGFLPYYSGGYIGYGTAVSASDYPNGITPEAARELMRATFATIGDTVERFFAKHGVTLTQQQFDALCSLGYNNGTGFLNANYRICKTIIAGNYTDNDLASAFGVWCHVGSTVNTHLAERRVVEAAIFLDGDYSGAEDAFRWVIYNADGGSIDTDIRFYRTGEPYGELLSASKSGYVFGGWYTSDGTKLTADDIVTSSLSVTAHWYEEGTEVDPEITQSEVAAPEELPAEAVPEVPEDETPGDAAEDLPVFSDLTTDHWYYDEVIDLVARGVVDGFTDGTFRGTNGINHAQALKLVLLAAGYDAQPATGSNWASGYYDLAVCEGLIDADEWADLTAPCTRLQIAQLACAALGLTDPQIESPFADIDDPAVNTLYTAGIFEGKYDTDGTLVFMPERELYRGETCVILWRILNWAENSHAE